ncbi:hemin uptake protein HemP [Halomonas caseinilytica]|uniref:hemin uptake protein HemP n=1 Tax=Halomonas caseinilytica TaxID=438744 RepID=UPI0009F37B6B|nr:hemin uptake protein HemP [Halomonas caseinilytica]
MNSCGESPSTVTRREEDTKAIDSQALLGRDGRLIIHHEGRRYVLRRTRLGKLILTT